MCVCFFFGGGGRTWAENGTDALPQRPSRAETLKSVAPESGVLSENYGRRPRCQVGMTSQAGLGAGLGRRGSPGWTRGQSGCRGQLRGQESVPAGTEDLRTALGASPRPPSPARGLLCVGGVSSQHPAETTGLQAGRGLPGAEGRGQHAPLRLGPSEGAGRGGGCGPEGGTGDR